MTCVPWTGAGDRILAASLSREPPFRARRRNFHRSPSSVVRSRRPFRGRRGHVGLNQPYVGTHLQGRGVDINTGRRGHGGLNQPYVGTHLQGRGVDINTGRRGHGGLNQPYVGTHLQGRGVDINTGRRGRVGLNQPYVGTHLKEKT